MPIVKDNVEMVFEIGSNTTYVNGEEAEIDVPSETMNRICIKRMKLIYNLNINLKKDSIRV
nr:stalk domain-containing protein [Anaeromicrobium sediminis]